MSLTQQQHKVDSHPQNTWKYVLCNDKFHRFFSWFWLNNTLNMNYHWKRPEIRPYLLEDYFCVLVESDSTTAQYWLLIAWPLKYCCNGKLNLRCCWLWVNNSTIQISHSKATDNTSSAMEDRLWIFYRRTLGKTSSGMTNSTCVIVDFDSRIEQIAFFIAKTAKIHHLYWKIPFVLLLS